MPDLRSLPKVDVLASSPLLEGYSQAVRVRAARAAVEMLRAQSRNDGADMAGAEALAALEASRIASSSMKRVINASGVILHTGLGRARLPELAVKRLQEIARNHAAVEIDLVGGDRGDRQEHVRGLLAELTGAEDALVVNNCAAAILLTLTALCQGMDVLLSRGEMIEIGGSFRMPDILAQSGCQMVEVGCTNKTRLSDFQEAIGETCGAILRCHPSNYRIIGFTESPSGPELSKLAKERGVLFIHDLGNGLLFDTQAFGLPKETTVQAALAEGADVVTASGDKMLGGPQVGMVLGRREIVKRIGKHPLARAVRVDKLALGALEATLQLHLEKRHDEIPTYQYLARLLTETKSMCQRLARAYSGRTLIEQGETEVGGGSAPGLGIPTWRVGLVTNDAVGLAKKLRSGEPAVLARIEKGAVWLDPRTLDPSEVKELCAILAKIQD